MPPSDSGSPSFSSLLSSAGVLGQTPKLSESLPSSDRPRTLGLGPYSRSAQAKRETERCPGPPGPLVAGFLDQEAGEGSRLLPGFVLLPGIFGGGTKAFRAKGPPGLAPLPRAPHPSKDPGPSPGPSLPPSNQAQRKALRAKGLQGQGRPRAFRAEGQEGPTKAGPPPGYAPLHFTPKDQESPRKPPNQRGPLRALTCRRPEKGRGYHEPQLTLTCPRPEKGPGYPEPQLKP